jgi:enamine deaminase RidA (YjgF/YER057c/UK114 family)
MFERIISPAVPEPPEGRYSQCLRAGDTLYISGQTAGAPGGGLLGDGSMGDQARQAFRKIGALLEAAGGSFADVVKLTIYVTDMSHRTEIQAARREFFSGDFPCSTLIGVTALAEPHLLVEVDATAILTRPGAR